MDWFDAEVNRLRAAGVDRPRAEARLLLAHAAGMPLEDVLAGIPEPPGFAALVERRAAREPLAYIIGSREFWSLRFAVSPATLIPRPDSETVVQAALDAAGEARRVLDLGTGTGCLLLAVLHERPEAFGVGVDRVPEAAVLAAANAAALGLGGRAAFAVADWGAALDGRFDLVLANPPYVRSGDIAGLAPELAHEPASALDGGADGLDAYRTILADLPRLLADNGVAVLEAGAGQAHLIGALAESHGFRARAASDLAGIDRAVVLQKAVGRGRDGG